MKVAILVATVVGFMHVLPPSVANSQETIGRSLGNESNKFELTVQISRVKHTDGQLLVAVFSDEAGFPKELEKAVEVAKTLPTKPELTFKNLPAGDYAVVVVHDRNRNNLIDRNVVGMPTEPVGLSNYKTIGLNNRPVFSKAKFSVRKNEVLSIKLISL